MSKLTAVISGENTSFIADIYPGLVNGRTNIPSQSFDDGSSEMLIAAVEADGNSWLDSIGSVTIEDQLGTNHWMVQYSLKPAARKEWGSRGVITAASRALLAYTIEQLDNLPEHFMFSIRPDNNASQRVASKLGARLAYWSDGYLHYNLAVADVLAGQQKGLVHNV